MGGGSARVCAVIHPEPRLLDKELDRGWWEHREDFGNGEQRRGASGPVVFSCFAVLLWGHPEYCSRCLGGSKPHTAMPGTS